MVIVIIIKKNYPCFAWLKLSMICFNGTNLHYSCFNIVSNNPLWDSPSWKNNQCQGCVMHPHFPKTAHPGVFYSSYTSAIYQQLTNTLWCSFIDPLSIYSYIYCYRTPTWHLRACYHFGYSSALSFPEQAHFIPLLTLKQGKTACGVTEKMEHAKPLIAAFSWRKTHWPLEFTKHRTLKSPPLHDK